MLQYDISKNHTIAMYANGSVDAYSRIDVFVVSDHSDESVITDLTVL